MFSELKRGLALGAKHGVRGVGMYTDPTVETPEMSENANMGGAIGIVVTIAAVVIALYIGITLIIDYFSKINNNRSYFV
jgi:hypothetical protein